MWIDITYVLLLIFAISKGWKQGLIISVFYVLAWIIGILAALKLCSVASIDLQQRFDLHTEWLPIISFLLVFSIVALIIYMIGKSLEKIIQIAHLGLINKLLGVVLRIAIYTFVFSTFLWLINQAGWISPSVKTQSKTYGFLAPVYDLVIDNMSVAVPGIKDLFSDLEKFFEKLSK